MLTSSTLLVPATCMANKLLFCLPSKSGVFFHPSSLKLTICSNDEGTARPEAVGQDGLTSSEVKLPQDTKVSSRHQDSPNRIRFPPGQPYTVERSFFQATSSLDTEPLSASADTGPTCPSFTSQARQNSNTDTDTLLPAKSKWQNASLATDGPHKSISQWLEQLKLHGSPYKELAQDRESALATTVADVIPSLRREGLATWQHGPSNSPAASTVEGGPVSVVNRTQQQVEAVSAANSSCSTKDSHYCLTKDKGHEEATTAAAAAAAAGGESGCAAVASSTVLAPEAPAVESHMSDRTQFPGLQPPARNIAPAITADGVGQPEVYNCGDVLTTTTSGTSPVAASAEANMDRVTAVEQPPSQPEQELAQRLLDFLQLSHAILNPGKSITTPALVISACHASKLQLLSVEGVHLSLLPDTAKAGFLPPHQPVLLLPARHQAIGFPSLSGCSPHCKDIAESTVAQGFGQHQAGGLALGSANHLQAMLTVQQGGGLHGEEIKNGCFKPPESSLAPFVLTGISPVPVASNPIHPVTGMGNTHAGKTDVSPCASPFDLVELADTTTKGLKLMLQASSCLVARRATPARLTVSSQATGWSLNAISVSSGAAMQKQVPITMPPAGSAEAAVLPPSAAVQAQALQQPPTVPTAQLTTPLPSDVLVRTAPAAMLQSYLPSCVPAVKRSAGIAEASVQIPVDAALHDVSVPTTVTLVDGKVVRLKDAVSEALTLCRHDSQLARWTRQLEELVLQAQNHHKATALVFIPSGQPATTMPAQSSGPVPISAQNATVSSVPSLAPASRLAQPASELHEQTVQPAPNIALMPCTVNPVPDDSIRAFASTTVGKMVAQTGGSATAGASLSAEGSCDDASGLKQPAPYAHTQTQVAEGFGGIDTAETGLSSAAASRCHVSHCNHAFPAQVSQTSGGFEVTFGLQNQDLAAVLELPQHINQIASSCSHPSSLQARGDAATAAEAGREPTMLAGNPATTSNADSTQASSPVHQRSQATKDGDVVEQASRPDGILWPTMVGCQLSHHNTLPSQSFPSEHLGTNARNGMSAVGPPGSPASSASNDLALSVTASSQKLGAPQDILAAGHSYSRSSYSHSSKDWYQRGNSRQQPGGTDAGFEPLKYLMMFSSLLLFIACWLYLRWQDYEGLTSKSGQTDDATPTEQGRAAVSSVSRQSRGADDGLPSAITGAENNTAASNKLKKSSLGTATTISQAQMSGLGTTANAGTNRPSLNSGLARDYDRQPTFSRIETAGPSPAVPAGQPFDITAAIWQAGQVEDNLPMLVSKLKALLEEYEARREMLQAEQQANRRLRKQPGVQQRMQDIKEELESISILHNAVQQELDLILSPPKTRHSK